MATLTITSKRQATFPAEACRELGLVPGDTVQLEAAMIEGRQVWVLKPRPVRARAWTGSLSRFGEKATDHSMRAIRASIATGRARERSR